MKSLEEVIKYKLNFLPKGTDPFYTIQTYKFKGYEDLIYLYETKNTIFSKDSFSVVEDITPLFIYISSCEKYYRENGYGEIKSMLIYLDIPNFSGFRGASYNDFIRFADFDTLNGVFNDLGENRIAIFKKSLNESFSRAGYCIRYIEPFNIRIAMMFIKFHTLVNNYKIFKSNECTICLQEEPKVLFCDCGHLCICKKCASHKYGNCPVCREKNTILRIIE